MSEKKSIARTMHMAVAIGLFERMDSQTLVECFTSDDGPSPTVEEIKEHLAELRRAGFEYMPCHCGNYDATGRCKGVK